MKNISNKIYKNYVAVNELIPTKMKTVLQKSYGDSSTLYIEETEIPVLKDSSETLIKVISFGINRADILQRNGKYPPPRGASSILGLECSGYLVENGKINKNKRVMALLSGGGYAEFAKCKKDHIMEIPEEIDLIKAAAIPEVWLTAYQNCKLSNIAENDVALVHAAASGVGTALIQLIRHYKAKSIALCSTEEKINYCKSLGATFSISRKDPEIKEKILNSYSAGCNVIYDCVGASAFDFNIDVCDMDAHWVNYGLLGGNLVKEINLGKLLAKRIQFNYTTLRNRSDEYKAKLVSDFSYEILPHFKINDFVPIIDKVYNVEEIREAHERMENNENIGKILVKWQDILV